MHRLQTIEKNCPDPQLGPIIKTAARAALAAGDIIRGLYEGSFKVRHKGEIDLVTEADEAAERAIIEIIKKNDPRTEIIAEESSSTYQGLSGQPAWLIDPLDGTTNFAHGFPWFGTSIAYTENGQSLVGVLFCPMLDELFYAGHGCGAWLNHDPIRVSTNAPLARSLTATGFPYDVQQDPEPIIGALRTILTRCQGVRRAGAAALDLAYVACGRLDGFWEIKLKPWDSGAGQILVTEAGGRLTTFSGGPYNPYIPEVLATNGLIHDEMVELLKPFSPGKETVRS